jgi:hypothetical protein
MVNDFDCYSKLYKEHIDFNFSNDIIYRLNCQELINIPNFHKFVTIRVNIKKSLIYFKFRGSKVVEFNCLT